MGALAQQLRVDASFCTTHTGFGHPTSALSADLMAVLVARHLLYDRANPTSPANDHLLYPADTHRDSQVGRVMAETAGVVYLRPTRGAYHVLYPHDERFVVGGSEVHRDRLDDEVALLGAGATCTPASAQRRPSRRGA